MIAPWSAAGSSTRSAWASRTRSGPRSCAVATYFAVFPAAGLRAPIALAQELALGAVEFAAGLGLSPHPDFAQTRGHLGELTDPCAITFGCNGRPLYVAGPHDDPIEIMRTLKSNVGSNGFAVAA